MHTIAKGQQKTQNDNKPFLTILWTNPEEEGQRSRSGTMRFASRLFRQNFLFALLYTLVSSEQMIRSLWHDLNSSWLSVWAFFYLLWLQKTMIHDLNPALTWNGWPWFWDDHSADGVKLTAKTKKKKCFWRWQRGRCYIDWPQLLEELLQQMTLLWMRWA